MSRNRNIRWHVGQGSTSNRGADRAVVEAHVGCRTAGANDPLNRNVPRIPCPSLIAWNSSMKAGALLLEIVELFAVSVSTFKAMLPAGAAPLRIGFDLANRLRG